MRHNGWKNYETWSVACLTDNEEGTYRERKLMAREAVAFAETDAEPGPKRRARVREKATDRLADLLKQQHEDGAWNALPNGLYLQLLNAALSEVDWHEIAGAWVEEEYPRKKKAQAAK